MLGVRRDGRTVSLPTHLPSHFQHPSPLTSNTPVFSSEGAEGDEGGVLKVRREECSRREERGPGVRVDLTRRVKG